MKKSTKILLTLMGALSIFAGIILFFSEGENPNAYFSIFIGISLIVSVYVIQPWHERELEKKEKEKID